MPLTTLPTKTDDSIGRAKVDRPSPFPRTPDLRYDVTAAEFERIKTAVVEVCEQVGLDDGSTEGSLEARVAAAVAPAASSSTPTVVQGPGGAGVATTYARGDHQHPARIPDMYVGAAPGEVDLTDSGRMFVCTGTDGGVQIPEDAPLGFIVYVANRTSGGVTINHPDDAWALYTIESNDGSQVAAYLTEVGATIAIVVTRNTGAGQRDLQIIGPVTHTAP